MGKEFDIINMIKENFNKDIELDSKLSKDFDNFNKTICFELTDVQKIYHFKITNKKASEVKEGKPPTYDIYLKSTFENFIAILTGKLNPAVAVLSKQIIIRGDIRDISKLQKIISKHTDDVNKFLKI